MSTKKQGIIQAGLVTTYCIVVGLFFGQMGKFFPKQDPVLAPVLFLTLFSASALICALIVFYKPYKLFFEGKKKEAAEVVIATAVSLFGFAILAFILALVIR